MLLTNDKNFDGILFIPHPYITTARPGRRLDENFLNTTLSKLNSAFDIAEKDNLLPVVLNGVTASANEHKVLGNVFQLLASKNVVVQAGKHEYKKINGELALDGNSTTALLSAARIANVVGHDDSVNHTVYVNINGKRVAISDMHANETRPTDILDCKHIEKVDNVILLSQLPITADTASDVGGATKINGVDLVVNTASAKANGLSDVSGSNWLFGGFLPRTLVSLSEQAPTVWKWTQDDIKPIQLPYVENSFETSLVNEAEHEVKAIPNKSDFVQILTDRINDEDKENSSSIESLFAETFAEEETEKEAQTIINELYQSVIQAV